MKKILKIIVFALGAVAGLLVVLLLAGSLMGGCATRNYVNSHAEELIGRQASVEHVGLNLLTGRVTMRGLEVMEEDGRTRFAGFDTLDVSVSLLRLLGRRVQVRHLTLAGFDAHIVQDSMRFNFSSMVDYLRGDTTAEEETDSTPSRWSVSMHRIRLSESSLLYEDRPRQSHIGFHRLNLLVPDFVVGGGERTDADLTVALAEGGELAVGANHDASTGDFEVRLRLEDFALDQLKPYVVDRTFIEHINGHLALTASARGNTAHIIESAIAANAVVEGVEVVDSSATAVAALKQLRVEVNKIVPGQRLIDVGSIDLDGLTASYELFADSSNTLSRLLQPKGDDSLMAATDSSAAAEEVDSLPQPPLQLRIGRVALRGINLTYADHTMPDDLVFPVTDISLEATDLTTTGMNNARLRANLPGGATLAADWQGNISQWKQHQHLVLNLKGLHLKDLSPYMVAYFGMPFSDGIFSFTSNNSIVASRLDGNNHIDIYKPTLGEKRPGVKPRLKLPVRAALYVLKDKDGKVLLDVPVKGNVDNPEFNYMKLVWKTLGNLIVKVATSPARLLKDMKDGGEELFVPIDAEEEDFTSEQLYLIDQLAEMVKDEEGMVLHFELQTRPNDNDRPATHHQHLNRALAHHLEKLGVGKKQYSIHTAAPDENVAMEGYAIELKIEN